MEIFEVHITGDSSIHTVAKKYKHKTIAIDLLRPDKTCLRTEHMTSIILKYPCRTEAYKDCLNLVEEIAQSYERDGVEIARVKIESPIYDYYVDDSLYVESHFPTDQTFYPISRNQKKTLYLATDREYKLHRYDNFMDIHEGKDLELCLYDTNPTEDLDWLKLFDGYNHDSFI